MTFLKQFDIELQFLGKDSMEYRDFIINLSILNFENQQIKKILEAVDILDDYKIVFDKDFLDSIEMQNSVKTRLLKYNANSIERLHSYCEKKNIFTIVDCDKNYPEKLRYIENSPKILYAIGDLSLLETKSVAIVGARKHSDYGANAVEYIVNALENKNVTVISGLAYGIDALSHRHSIKNNIRTIGVLAGGVDIIYPKSNEYLYNKIIKKDLIISEYVPGLYPKPYRFPLRNRIISGLSEVVVVIEARYKSGSLITARLAAEQGREVFALPGNINSIYSEGTNLLIRDGAQILTTVDDLLFCLGCDNSTNLTSSDKFKDLGADEVEIIDLINSGVNEISLIAMKLKKDVSIVNSMMTILELKELINISGEHVSIKS